jgi:pimeloyl-ACP methyl ester carboxylesterase
MTAKMHMVISHLVLALLVLVLAGSAQAQAAPAGSVPRFEPAPCPLPAPAGVACGYLVVWEDRAEPAGGTIRLPIAILPSDDSDPEPDPVVYLTGGPGSTAIAGVNAWRGHPARAHRDLILLEQRGTRYAEPALACPEVHDVLRGNMTLALSGEEEVAREVAAAAACRDRLLAEGVDLSAYNSAASAADIAELRQVLGYEQINLLGVSYGTRLALTILRDYPEGIRSVVLNSAFPVDVDTYIELVPNAQAAFHALFADCEADPACRAAYPDVEETFYRVLEAANRDPIAVDIPTPPYHVLLTAKDIIAGMFQSLGQLDRNAIVPFLVDQMDKRNVDALVPMVENGVPGLFGFSRGMMQSVECYEEAPFNPWEEIVAAARVRPVLLDYLPIHFNLAICDVWPSGQAGPIEDEPVHSDVPVLLLAGAYDPYTPPSWSAHAVETLSNGYVFVFPGLGHGPLGYSRCARDIAAAFWADPDTPPDGSCIAGMARPDFLVPSDVYLTPGPYRLNTALYTVHDNLRLGLAGTCLAAFALAAVSTPIGGWATRRRPPTPSRALGRIAAVVAIAVSLLYLAFAAALILVVQKVSATNWLLLAFGVPAAAAPLFWLPRLAALFTPVLAGLALWTWRARAWTRAWRVAYTLLAIATVAFGALLIDWKMLTWPF